MTEPPWPTDDDFVYALSPMTPRVIIEVIKERNRQDEKWGVQYHRPLYWIGILGEEYGEACKEAIEFNTSKFRAELVQVAAVAIAAIEDLDR